MVSDMGDEEGVLEDSLGGLGPSSPSLALCSLPGQSTALRAGEGEVRAADGQGLSAQPSERIPLGGKPGQEGKWCV